MASITLGRSSGRGLRPFELRRDLGGVADLLEIAFADELAAAQRSGQELRLLYSVAPVLWLVGLVVPPVRHLFEGYVWVEDGRIVGNANINRLRGQRDLWLIGNVAVHPNHRRRGIARRLTQAAVELIADKGGRAALLDVRADNAPAYHLYLELGFRRLTTQGEWVIRRPYDLPLQPSPWAVRRLGREDWPLVYDLAERATPSALAALIPLRERDFRRGRWGSQDSAPRWSLGADLDLGLESRGRLIAAARRQGAGSQHSARLTLLVDPLYQGQVEHALISEAVGDILDYRRRELVIEAWAASPALVETLTGLGARQRLDLHRMGLAIR